MVPFSSVEPARRGERGQSRSRSRRQPAGSSGPRWSAWGCPQGEGARGWRCRCPRSSARWWCCCRCPTRRRSPSRDRTLPARLHGGGHAATVTPGHTKPPPRGLRAAPRLDITMKTFPFYLFHVFTQSLCAFARCQLPLLPHFPVLVHSQRAASAGARTLPTAPSCYFYPLGSI